MFASSRRFIFSIIIYRWGRLKDAMPERANSRGFLNPWYSSVSHTSAVCKDANRQRFVVQGRETLFRSIGYADFFRLLNRPFGIILPYRDVTRKEKNMFLCSFVKKIIRVPLKIFTKPYFRRNPVGKPEMTSWKNIISQLENYFFSVGNLFFPSRAVF